MTVLLALVACRLPEPGGEDDVDITPTARIDDATWQGFVQTRGITSSKYHIDAKYASMRGPSGFDHAVLLETEEPELLWITGYKTLVVDAKTEEKLSQEFMCHANLDFDAKEYYDHFPKAPPLSGRVFTLSQGQQEIHFPTGMGIPIRSDLELSLATQVLNLNIEKPDLDVRHKVVIEFVRDSDLNAYRTEHPDFEVVPLYQTAVQGFKALGNARYYGVAHDDADPNELGEGCSVGMSAIDGDIDEDRLGQEFTAHWVVPPGTETNRTNVTRFLNLPYDTTVYYIATHLHPFAESLTMNDLNTGQQVYQSKVRNTPDKIGIDEVDIYSSFEGIDLKEDHEYELVSVYNNTSGHDIDSMAVLYFYALDKNFDRKRSLGEFKQAAKEQKDDDKESKHEKSEPASM
ncbi:MAG: hypothetical protein H6737_02255 [Alphaproteobacteria bacterium]|nr:hypothetical protein [Alphaproteobacteria bacterium]